MHKEGGGNGRRLRDALLLCAGATLTALAAKYIYDPAGLVTGGVTGLSIVVRHVSAGIIGREIPLWAGTLLFNIPIFLFAIHTSGIRSVLRTGFVWLLMTAELYIFPEAGPLSENLLLVAIYGGIFMGVGSGLLLTAKATSGGSDMLGESLHHYLRSVSVGRLIQVIDGAVVLLGLLVFGVEPTLFAMISVYISGKIVDLIIGRGRRAKMATIISEKNDLIAGEIMKSLGRGVTALRGEGMYTGEDRKVLLCICSNRDLVAIKDIVRKHDERAFFIVGDVSEAMGEGFVEDWAREG